MLGDDVRHGHASRHNGSHDTSYLLQSGVEVGQDRHGSSATYVRDLASPILAPIPSAGLSTSRRRKSRAHLARPSPSRCCGGHGSAAGHELRPPLPDAARGRFASSRPIGVSSSPSSHILCERPSPTVSPHDRRPRLPIHVSQLRSSSDRGFTWEAGRSSPLDGPLHPRFAEAVSERKRATSLRMAVAASAVGASLSYSPRGLKGPDGGGVSSDVGACESVDGHDNDGPTQQRGGQPLHSPLQFRSFVEVGSVRTYPHDAVPPTPPSAPFDPPSPPLSSEGFRRGGDEGAIAITPRQGVCDTNCDRVAGRRVGSATCDPFVVAVPVVDHERRDNTVTHLFPASRSLRTRSVEAAPSPRVHPTPRASSVGALDRSTSPLRGILRQTLATLSPSSHAVARSDALCSGDDASPERTSLSHVGRDPQPRAQASSAPHDRQLVSNKDASRDPPARSEWRRWAAPLREAADVVSHTSSWLARVVRDGDEHGNCGGGGVHSVHSVGGGAQKFLRDLCPAQDALRAAAATIAAAAHAAESMSRSEGGGDVPLDSDVVVGLAYTAHPGISAVSTGSSAPTARHIALPSPHEGLVGEARGRAATADYAASLKAAESKCHALSLRVEIAERAAREAKAAAAGAVVQHAARVSALEAHVRELRVRARGMVVSRRHGIDALQHRLVQLADECREVLHTTALVRNDATAMQRVVEMSKGQVATAVHSVSQVQAVMESMRADVEALLWVEAPVEALPPEAEAESGEGDQVVPQLWKKLPRTRTLNDPSVVRERVWKMEVYHEAVSTLMKEVTALRAVVKERSRNCRCGAALGEALDEVPVGGEAVEGSQSTRGDKRTKKGELKANLGGGCNVPRGPRGGAPRVLVRASEGAAALHAHKSNHLHGEGKVATVSLGAAPATHTSLVSHDVQPSLHRSSVKRASLTPSPPHPHLHHCASRPYSSKTIAAPYPSQQTPWWMVGVVVEPPPCEKLAALCNPPQETAQQSSEPPRLIGAQGIALGSPVAFHSQHAALGSAGGVDVRPPWSAALLLPRGPSPAPWSPPPRPPTADQFGALHSRQSHPLRLSDTQTERSQLSSLDVALRLLDASERKLRREALDVVAANAYVRSTAQLRQPAALESSPTASSSTQSSSSLSSSSSASTAPQVCPRSAEGEVVCTQSKDEEVASEPPSQQLHDSCADGRSSLTRGSQTPSTPHSLRGDEGGGGTVSLNGVADAARGLRVTVPQSPQRPQRSEFVSPPRLSRLSPATQTELSSTTVSSSPLETSPRSSSTSSSAVDMKRSRSSSGVSSDVLRRMTLHEEHHELTSSCVADRATPAPTASPPAGKESPRRLCVDSDVTGDGSGQSVLAAVPLSPSSSAPARSSRTPVARVLQIAKGGAPKALTSSEGLGSVAASRGEGGDLSESSISTPLPPMGRGMFGSPQGAVGRPSESGDGIGKVLSSDTLTRPLLSPVRRSQEVVLGDASAGRRPRHVRGVDSGDGPQIAAGVTHSSDAEDPSAPLPRGGQPPLPSALADDSSVSEGAVPSEDESLMRAPWVPSGSTKPLRRCEGRPSGADSASLPPPGGPRLQSRASSAGSVASSMFGAALRAASRAASVVGASVGALRRGSVDPSESPPQLDAVDVELSTLPSHAAQDIPHLRRDSSASGSLGGAPQAQGDVSAAREDGGVDQDDLVGVEVVGMWDADAHNTDPDGSTDSSSESSGPSGLMTLTACTGARRAVRLRRMRRAREALRASRVAAQSGVSGECGVPPRGGGVDAFEATVSDLFPPFGPSSHSDTDSPTDSASSQRHLCPSHGPLQVISTPSHNPYVSASPDSPKLEAATTAATSPSPFCAAVGGPVGEVGVLRTPLHGVSGVLSDALTEPCSPHGVPSLLSPEGHHGGPSGDGGAYRRVAPQPRESIASRSFDTPSQDPALAWDREEEDVRGSPAPLTEGAAGEASAKGGGRPRLDSGRDVFGGRLLAKAKGPGAAMGGDASDAEFEMFRRSRAGSRAGVDAGNGHAEGVAHSDARPPSRVADTNPPQPPPSQQESVVGRWASPLSHVREEHQRVRGERRVAAREAAAVRGCPVEPHDCDTDSESLSGSVLVAVRAAAVAGDVSPFAARLPAASERPRDGEPRMRPRPSTALGERPTVPSGRGELDVWDDDE